ncbi:MAG TPA: PQQ-binding-like beta-propeller repeat protein [Polyangia bacterium]|nr:PQQ-binding-like beta-propeller repeat protein [Polyangia bacterium]
MTDPGRRHAPRAVLARGVGCGLVALAVGFVACATPGRPRDPADAPAHRAGVLTIRWRATLHEHGLFEPAPEECATGALAHGRVVVGSRAGAVVGVDAAQGHVDWATTVSGGVDGEARFDPEQDQVYVGADDGALFAIDAQKGGVRWTYRTKGAIERPAVFGGTGAAAGLVYGASASDRLFALEAATGKWRWGYERETPEGFTIHGYSGPRLAEGRIYAGFADGFLVSLAAGTGEVQWARSLAAASDQFVDVDATPAIVKGPGKGTDVLYTSSYSGGFYALDPRDGNVRWRVGTEGVGTITPFDDRLYFAAPRQGLHATDLQGHTVWRQGLTEAGDLTAPTVLGRYLVFSGSRAGLFIVDRDSGELLELFNPGQGVCAAPTIDAAARRLYVLTNGGTLYALDF